MSEEDGWKSFFLDRRSRGAVEEVTDVTRVLAGDGSVLHNLLKLHLGWRDVGDPQEEDEEEMADWPDAQVRARGVTRRARWVTLRARWVTLRARWVTLRAR